MAKSPDIDNIVDLAGNRMKKGSGFLKMYGYPGLNFG